MGSGPLLIPPPPSLSALCMCNYNYAFKIWMWTIHRVDLTWWCPELQRWVMFYSWWYILLLLMVMFLGDADNIQGSLYYQALEGYGGHLTAYSRKSLNDLGQFSTVHGCKPTGSCELLYVSLPYSMFCYVFLSLLQHTLQAFFDKIWLAIIWINECSVSTIYVTQKSKNKLIKALKLHFRTPSARSALKI